jgi:hypothetical protein
VSLDAAGSSVIKIVSSELVQTHYRLLAIREALLKQLSSDVSGSSVIKIVSSELVQTHHRLSAIGYRLLRVAPVRVALRAQR